MFLRVPHYYAIHSRLGLLNTPHGGIAPNIGVEEGPTALLTLLNKRGVITTTNSYVFPYPENIDPTRYFDELATHSNRAKELITTNLQANETMVDLGGDHSISYASLQAVLAQHKAPECGVLIFDSHADLHQPSTSPSGNFHGMWLRPFLDTFEEAVINAAVPQKLHPNQVLFVGNLLTEPAEAAFMQSEHIENISAIDTAAQERVTQFLNSYHHLHVSFDIDVFASAYVPGVGTPNPSGLTPPQVWPLLRQIKTHPSISLDMVEVNPRQKGSERTVKLASRVLKEVLR